MYLTSCPPRGARRADTRFCPCFGSDLPFFRVFFAASGRKIGVFRSVSATAKSPLPVGEHSAIPFFGSLLGLIHLRFFCVGVRLAPEREGIVKQHEFADEIDQLGGDLLVSEVCQKVRGDAAAVDDLLPGFEEVFQDVIDHLAGADVLMANRVKLIHAEADAEEAVLAGFFPALPLGAVAAGGSQTADHFAVRDIHQRVEMQSSVLLSVLKDAHVVPAAAGVEVGQTSAEGGAEILLAVELAVLVGDGDKVVPLVEICFLTKPALAEVEVMLLAFDHAGDPCCIVAVKDAVMLVHVIGDPELDVLFLFESKNPDPFLSDRGGIISIGQKRHFLPPANVLGHVFPVGGIDGNPIPPAEREECFIRDNRIGLSSFDLDNTDSGI